MPAEQFTASDVDGAVRAWLRDVLDVPVFFGVNNDATFPQVVVFRIGGPDWSARFQFDVWGGSKDEASLSAAAVATQLSACRYRNGSVVLHGATWESTRWMPDEETDRPRYLMEATVTATAVA